MSDTIRVSFTEQELISIKHAARARAEECEALAARMLGDTAESKNYADLWLSFAEEARAIEAKADKALGRDFLRRRGGR